MSCLWATIGAGISQCGYISGQVSTEMSHHLSPIKMAVIKASKRQQGLEGPEEVEDGRSTPVVVMSVDTATMEIAWNRLKI